MSAKTNRVAVVGAGMSGLCCARRLDAAGYEVSLFDKGRRAGGRMSTRRDDGGRTFDHGAQYFTARDSAFAAEVQRWVADGVAAPWLGRIAVVGSDPADRPSASEAPVRYVGTPTMSAICRHLASGLNVRTSCRIASVTRHGSAWRLADSDKQDHGEFDTVVVSTPAGQAVDLLLGAPSLAEQARAVTMSPCWAVMVTFPDPLDLPFDAAFVHGSPLGWVARQSSKPGRTPGATWVLHATPSFTQARWEEPSDDVVEALVEAFATATGQTFVAPTSATGHRWRFALPSEPLPDRCLWDPQLQIGAIGDWCGGPRVEGAALSGWTLARHIAQD